MKTTFNRRDVLKAGTALTARRPVRRAASAPRRPPAEAVTPALIEAAKKEGKVVHYTSVDLPLAEKVGKAFEAKYPGIAVRIERTGAERVFTAHRPGARQQHPRLRRGAVVGRRAFRGLEARRHPGALCARGGRQALSGRAQGPGRAVRQLPRLSLRDGAQHRSGEGRGRAEELRRSARSEMGGQDRQGASGLQRHHPDRDLPDRARRRLGLLREARQAEGHAGAVGLRPAEEACARRARDHGRRHRVRRVPAQGEGQAGRCRSIRSKARR